MKNDATLRRSNAMDGKEGDEGEKGEQGEKSEEGEKKHIRRRQETKRKYISHVKSFANYFVRNIVCEL